jgi:hypothetical protein
MVEEKGVYMAQREATVEELWAEQQGIEGALEAAALEGDREGFVDALMRRYALPHEIAEARLRPLRERIAELDQQAREVDAEIRQVMEGPLPERYDPMSGEMADEHVRIAARDAQVEALVQRRGLILQQRPELLRQLRELEQAPLVAP